MKSATLLAIGAGLALVVSVPSSDPRVSGSVNDGILAGAEQALAYSQADAYHFKQLPTRQILNGTSVVISVPQNPSNIILLPEWQKTAKRVFKSKAAEATASISLHLEGYPSVSPVIRGTGGFRKLRWSVAGWASDARVIYNWIGPGRPLFLGTVYAKNKRENLSNSQRNDLKAISTEIKRRYKV